MADISKIKLPNEAEPRLVKDTEARNIANSKAADTVFIPANPSAVPPVEAKRGLVPPPPSTPGTAKFLREDCTWAEPSGTGGTSDYDDLNDKPQINSVTLEGNKTAAQLGLQKSIKVDVSGTVTAIADANNDTEFVAGANVTITGDTSDGTITISATDTTYSTFDATHAGLAPAGGTTAGFLKNDGSWATPQDTTYTEGTGIDISNANVISNTGVTAVGVSSTNGKISVTTNGTTDDVAVAGLSDAAYKGVDVSIPSSGATDNKVPTTAAVKSGLDSKLDATANAASAAKLNTGSADYEVGTATKGVYFDDGIPKAMTYSVEADVPSGAVFTDTTYTEATNSAISVDNTNHTIDVAAATTTAKGVVQLSTTLPASTATEDNKVPTALTVSKAIAALPEPMVFKGTVNGTYPATPSVGDTYKATANSTSGVTPAYKMGDTVIYSEPSTGTFEWVVIPSGDEPSGTVTGITGSDGIVTLDSTTSSSTISTSGTAKLALVTNHTTTVNAGNATSTANRSYPVAIDGNSKLAVNVPWENTTYANGSGITIGTGNAINHSNSVTAVTTAGAYKVKYDAQGHITGTSALAASDISAVPTSRTVNSKALSSNITLAGSDIALTGYSKGSSTAAVAATDTINAAIAKHENRIDTNQSNILYAIRNGAKNLCKPILDPAYYDKNGAAITRTYSNGAITIKGTTATAEAYLAVCEEFTPINTGDYVFSSASGLIQGKLEMYVAAGSSFVGERVTASNPARTYSLTAGTTYTLGMVISANYTIDTTIYPMLCEKTVWDNLNHDFQPPSLANYDLTRGLAELNAHPFLTIPANHNMVYRGQNLGATLTDAQHTALSSGNFTDLYLGDYWTKTVTIPAGTYTGGDGEEVTVPAQTNITLKAVIADFDTFYAGYDSTYAGINTHHAAVIVTGFSNVVWNKTDSTAGGYVASLIHKWLVGSVLPQIETWFGSAKVLSHQKLLTNAITGDAASGWEWSSQKISLLSENQMYGSKVWGNSKAANGGYEPGEAFKHLSVFNHIDANLLFGNNNIWLRDIASAVWAANLGNFGRASYYVASKTWFAPAALILLS